MSATILAANKPSRNPRSVQWTEEQDQIIREAWPLIYRRELNVPTLAARLSVPHNQLRCRAMRLGVVPLKGPSRPWTDDEVEYMRSIAHLGVQAIQKNMKRKGWWRTLNAIGLKLSREEQRTRGENTDVYSGEGLARLIGVSSSTVHRWIRLGLLKAKRRNGTGIASDKYDINPRHVAQFIRDHTAHVDISRADRFWLVDLLTGSADSVTDKKADQ